MDPLDIYTPYIPGDWPETWIEADNRQPEWRVSDVRR